MWQEDLYKRGFQCELTFLGVRIVQEQQAHGSSGRFQRSSLMMISIIQAICANRCRVFIHHLKIVSSGSSAPLPSVLFDYHLFCFSPTFSKDDHCSVPVGLRIQFPCVGVSQGCAASVSVTANPCVTLRVLDFTLFRGKKQIQFCYSQRFQTMYYQHMLMLVFHSFFAKTLLNHTCLHRKYKDL